MRGRNCARRLVGQSPTFTPRYLDLASHYGFEIRACGIGKGNEKGRVENGVGYVKKHFLAGLEMPDFRMVNPAACTWRDEIANVRPHGTTHKPPRELFAVEKPAMNTLPGALHVTRRQDLMEMEIPEPNLSIYDPESVPDEGGDQ